MIVRVIQLGMSGYRFEHPAYARSIDGPGAGRAHLSLDFMVLDERDVRGLESQGYHAPRTRSRGYSAPQHHYVPLDDDSDEAAYALVLWALNSEDMIIINQGD